MAWFTHGSIRRPVIASTVVAAALAVLFTAGSASGRPGGGHSYSGSSSRSSSSSSSRGSFSSGGGFGSHASGGGGGDLSGGEVLVILLVMGAVFTVMVVYSARKRRAGAQEEDSSAPAQPRTESRSIRRELMKLRATDADFSIVLFQDFLYALYAHAHESRAADGKLDELLPYLDGEARSALERSGRPEKVKGVIVGAMRFMAVGGMEAASSQVEVEVEFEGNYTEVSEGKEQSFYSVERWTLVRGKQVRSRAPDKIRAFVCPSCGGPLSALRGNTCSYCYKVIDTGEFDWFVTGIAFENVEPRGALFSEGAEEQGTDLPTVFEPDAGERLLYLQARDPAFSWPAFEARLGLIFSQLQEAWSNREWTHARPYVSDRLFQSTTYWIDAYREAHLRNVTENARIARIELCRVETDRWYDALTVRVHASSIDYTISDQGEVKSGSQARRRAYTEYWTLIRGAQVKGSPSSTKSCPQCGAGLRIDMAGSCEYCGAKVTSGAFDWVLSLIEQDESYGG